MGKKKETENVKAESGTGEQHIKQGDKKGPKKKHKRAEAGSGTQHCKQGEKVVDNEIHSDDSGESETETETETE